MRLSTRVAIVAVSVLAVFSSLASGDAGPGNRDNPDPKQTQGPRFPAFVTDIGGQTLDIEALARDRNLVVVTLKATWCHVCQEQLVRIRGRLAELEACGVTFIVLSPGPPKELKRIRKATQFEFPFVADEGLALARSLGIDMTEDQILPCMLQILPSRGIGWRQLGRSGNYFGDEELTKFFDCSRFVSGGAGSEDAGGTARRS